MQLTGKRLAISLPGVALGQVLGLRILDMEEQDWLLGGKVVGESPSGIWLSVEAVAQEGRQKQLQQFADETPIYLVPWRFLSTVRVMPGHGRRMYRSMGFRQDVPATADLGDELGRPRRDLGRPRMSADAGWLMDAFQARLKKIDREPE